MGISFVSGEGGTGTTTIAMNFALYLFRELYQKRFYVIEEKAKAR